MSIVQRLAFTQTPRDRLKKLVDMTGFLRTGETILTVSTTVIPPTGSQQQAGFVPPGFDQRIVTINTAAWAFNGVQTSFPLTSLQGNVAVGVLGDQYVALVLSNQLKQPSVDFTIAGSQLVFAVAPVALTPVWCLVQNPVLPAGSRRDVLTDPPYTAFAAETFIVAPDNKQFLLTSMGGSAPLTYRVRALVQTSGGEDKEIHADFSIREP